MLILVSVKKYRINVPIGWYQEEIISKTELYVDVEIEYRTNNIEDDLTSTIDYAQIHKILKQVSRKHFRLLESFAQACMIQIKSDFGHLNLKYATITLEKPQILEKGSAVDSQSVRLRMDF